MGLVTLGGRPIAGGLYNATSTATPVLQDRVMMFKSHSLVTNANPWQAIVPWIDRMMDADGGQSLEAQMTYDNEASDPTVFDQDWVSYSIPSPGAGATWASIDATGMTDLIHTTDNHTGPPAFHSETDPSVGGPVPRPAEGDWSTEMEAIIDGFELNLSNSPNYWIYECWPDGGPSGFPLIASDGSSTPTNFASWRARAGGNWTTWYDNLLSQAKANVPGAASRIEMIPVCRAMVDVMENTALSALDSDDWFVDDAPHGTQTCYLFAAMVTYTILMQQQAPTPSFTGTSVNSTFTSNYTTIAARLVSEWL